MKCVEPSVNERGSAYSAHLYLEYIVRGVKVLCC